ncbi:MAG: polyprenyl synthetase family protein [Candidatus Lokiarchaeota archaeon]|nr:polyprenyl synthetase family protein [Candidatus Lokiarchaeota archaeon]
MIEEFLKTEKSAIDAILEDYFKAMRKSENDILIKDFIKQLEKFSINPEAKRIHPILLIAAFGGIVNRMYLEDNIDIVRRASIAVELLHEGNLIHDDLIDNDLKRRGKPTFHIQLKKDIEQIYKNQNIVRSEEKKELYGRDLSILGGTLGYLLGLDILKASKFPDNVKLLAINEYSEALNYLIRGQIIEEYMDDHNITMSMEQYLNIAELQKARIFEKSSKIGALLARGNIHYQIQPLSEAMLKIGQAYAIRDDILDIEEDILQQKKKFLYIISIQNTNEEQSNRLQEVFSKTEKLKSDDIKHVKEIFKETNAFIIADHFSKNLVEQAKKDLKEIYPDLNKDQKLFFEEFTEYIYTRTK